MEYSYELNNKNPEKKKRFIKKKELFLVEERKELKKIIKKM